MQKDEEIRRKMLPSFSLACSSYFIAGLETNGEPDSIKVEPGVTSRASFCEETREVKSAVRFDLPKWEEIHLIENGKESSTYPIHSIKDLTRS